MQVQSKENERQPVGLTLPIIQNGRTTEQVSKNTAAAQAAASSSGNTSITANDFLTLLVAEMKHQDPTSTQDPNAYIDQLVQVNSLQQLIQINQDLGSTASTGSSSGTSGVSPVVERHAVGSASALATSLAPKADHQALDARTQRIALAASHVKAPITGR